MKKIILFVFLSVTYMQEVGPDWSDEAKATYYQTEKISPEKALLLQFVNLPFANLGYAYSDNWKRGFKWDLSIIGAIVLSGIIEDEECYWNYSSYYEFNIFIGAYLTYVRKNYPVMYNEILDNKEFRRAYGIIDKNFHQLAIKMEKCVYLHEHQTKLFLRVLI